MNLCLQISRLVAVASAILLAACDKQKPAPSSEKAAQTLPAPTEPTKQTLPEWDGSSTSEPPEMKSVLSEGGNSAIRPALREKLPQVSGGTVMHPAAEQARQSLGKELMAVLSDKIGSVKLILDRWDNAAASLPRSPLASASLEQVQSGKALPNECKDVIRNDGAFASRLISGTYQGVQTPEAIGGAAIIQILATGMGEQLPAALQKHTTSMPPTEADLVIFAAALTSIGDKPPSMANPQPWQDLATAANPMYRLLALRAARQGEWTNDDTAARLAFASHYDNETDPTILLELVQMLGTVPGSQARQRLEALKQKAIRSNDNGLSSEIDQALRSHELLTTAGAANR